MTDKYKEKAEREDLNAGKDVLQSPRLERKKLKKFKKVLDKIETV